MNARQSRRTALFLAACIVALPAHADVFELTTGGEVRGRLANPDEKPRETYEVKTPSGTVVTLSADQVRRVVRQTAEREEYDRRCITTPDTPDGHWQLARWCLEKKLLRERKRQLRRVIELDSDHAEARRILGYRRVRDQWMSREDEMRSRGFVLYEGDWRTPQDVEIRARRQQIETTQNEWRKKAKLWRGWLGGRKIGRVEEGKKNFLAADDPLAAPAIVALLDKEKVYEIKLLLLEALSDNRHTLAVDAIAKHALEDADGEVRYRCIEYLAQKSDRSLVRHFVRSLESDNNIEVNRAAVILGSLGFPDAISPLIDALITKHKIKNPNAGRTSARFSPQGGGGGLSMGGKAYVTVQLKNQEVLSALVKLTGGQSFEFEQQAWQRWYTTSQREGSVDMRRD